MFPGDALLKQGIPPPDLVKIDVEGTEALALEGLRRTLATHHPVLFVELHPTRSPDEVARARELLREHGYWIEVEIAENELGWGLIHVFAVPVPPMSAGG